jgi:proteasome lid subunit RPN8/RPN11
VKRICLPHRRPRGYGFSFLQRTRTGQRHLPAARPDALLQSVKHRADHTVEEIITAVAVELKQGKRDLFDIVWEELSFLGDVEHLLTTAAYQLGQAPPPPREALVPAVPVYVVNSLFLADCHRFLLSDPKGYELMHLVTGSRVDTKTRTLERMEQVALASHSHIHAEADQHDLQRRLIEMSAWGLAMHGLFHAHPGEGRGATRPSGIDLETHERFERGRYPIGTKP